LSLISLFGQLLSESVLAMFASKAFIFLGLVGIATAIDCISEYGQRCKPKNEMNPHFAPKYTTGDPCFLENNVRVSC
jgi:hypothetical protein